MSRELKPLLLHAHPVSPNPVKIAIALECLQVPYTVKIWEFNDNPRTGVKGEDFTKINPNGRVPALQDPNTDVTAWESGAILNYLRSQYDAKNILGPVDSSPQAKADLEAWEYLLLTTLGPFTGQVAWFKYFHPTKNEDAAERYTKQVYRVYGILEAQLKKSGGKTIVPSKFTTVDIHYMPWLWSSKYNGLSLDEYPLLSQWIGTMKDKPEVKQAQQRMQNAAAEQDPEAAARGPEPDVKLLRHTRAQDGH